MPRYDYAVLGAGIIGLETARLLASRGCRVALIERGDPARKASWAAAGILTRRGALPDRGYGRLYAESVLAYPEWLRDLERETGRAITLTRGGDYCLMREGPALKKMRSQLETSKNGSFEMLAIPPASWPVRAIPPELTILHFPEEMYVNNRELLEALLAAVTAAPALTTFFNAGIPEVRLESGGVRLRLAGGPEVEAGHLCVCAGVWSGQVLADLGWHVPLKPVRGQIYLVPRWHAGNFMVHLDDHWYFVPRGDRLMAGATSESGVWEEGLSEAGRADLERSFQSFLPDFRIPADAPGWSGLRPKNADGRPLIGFLAGHPNLSVNCGHFRSGISLAPRGCRLYVEGLLAGEMPAPLAECRPARPKGLRPIGTRLPGGADTILCNTK